MTKLSALDVFTRLDTNSDGHCSLLELSAGLEEGGASLTSAEVVALLRKLDADGDGRVSLADFVRPSSFAEYAFVLAYGAREPCLTPQEAIAAAVVSTGGGLWSDPDFPPSTVSLGAAGSRDAVHATMQLASNDIAWRRLSELYPRCTLFGPASVAPAPGDVMQGPHADCWLVCAMSLATTLAPRAAGIRHLFLDADGAGDAAVYGVQLYHSGSWQTVLVDDWVPVVPQAADTVATVPPSTELDAGASLEQSSAPTVRLAFSRHRDPSVIWVAILQKASFN